MYPDDVCPVIQCERVDLHHLSAKRLIDLFTGENVGDVCRDRSYTNPYGVLSEVEPPIRWRAPQVLKDPSTNTWFIRWIVLRESAEIIGSTSFHGPPDDDGMLEIGLGLHEHFHRQGFGYEAVIGMWSWAASQPDVARFRYTVSPGNVASVALVEKCGFTRVGQQMDDIDGLEDIYEMSVEEFRARFMQGPRL